MWTYYPDLLAKPVPRYTSYPTAAEFGPLSPSASEAYADALTQAEGDISLYLHIPFCEKICFYCGCNTGAAGRTQRLESYLAALHREIASVAEMLPASARVRRISFGGGSPNAIAPNAFLELIAALDQHFSLADPIISAELDPRTMSRDWADALKSAGVSRASLGVQTFAPHCQQAIGRVQDEALVAQTTEWLRGAGVTSLNFDMMYGLPHQTSDDLADSLARAQRLGADRIALFGYAHVPHMVPRQRVIDAAALPDQGARFAMAREGYHYLTGAGYAPIGFDHFARAATDPLALAAENGNLRRNFQGFTDDCADNLIGLGSSAISSFSSLIVQNEKNSGRYRMRASEGRLAVEIGIRRSREDQLRGRVIEELLCHGHASLPPCLRQEAATALEPFIARDLVQLDFGALHVKEAGLPYARTIAAIFDPYRAASPRRFSAAV